MTRVPEIAEAELTIGDCRPVVKMPEVTTIFHVEE